MTTTSPPMEHEGLYRSYSELPKLQPLVAEISWAKNLVILARVKDPLEREFYLRATAPPLPDTLVAWVCGFYLRATAPPSWSPVTASPRNCPRITRTTCPARKASPNGWSN